MRRDVSEVEKHSDNFTIEMFDDVKNIQYSEKVYITVSFTHDEDGVAEIKSIEWDQSMYNELENDMILEFTDEYDFFEHFEIEDLELENDAFTQAEFEDEDDE